ncbi:hypothetical protein FLAVO9R_130034 [Flavobacterium sp. 9R]|nr:hypothetical protein FLAVO9R_130034 [Flavobacterium sp. 9R]
MIKNIIFFKKKVLIMYFKKYIFAHGKKHLKDLIFEDEFHKPK